MIIDDFSVLPLGTVVSLRNNTNKIVIISRGAVFFDSLNDQEVFADYVGAYYPLGFESKETIFFNNNDIESVIFRGYSDEEEDKFLQLYRLWKKDMVKKYK